MISNKRMAVFISAVVIFFSVLGFNLMSADAAVYQCKLASVEPEGRPKHAAQVWFTERVAELTNNEVQITLYPGNQLGSSRELVEAAQIGSIQGVGMPTSSMTGFAPNMAVFDLPFLFPSRDIGHKVIESEVGDAVLAVLENHGLVGVSFYGSGWKQFTGNFRIEGPESFKGKKIRVMENPILIAQFQALGANAIPISFEELYNALQQGVVDGQENPISTCVEMKIYEVQKYMARSDHAYLPSVFAFNKAWYHSLPKQHQEAIMQAGKEMDQRLREVIQENELKEYLPSMVEYGLEVVELSPEIRSQFAEIIQGPTRARFFELADEDGKKLLEMVDAKIAELK